MKDILFGTRFLLALSWRTNRRRLAIGATLLLLGFLATPVVALALRQFVNVAVAGRAGTATGWAVLAAVALVFELMSGHFAHLFYFELGEMDELALNRELLRLVNGVPELDRCEDTAFVDTVDLLREDIVKMRATVQAVLQLSCLLVQALVTAVLLALLQPWLLLLPPMAVVPVILGKRAESVLERARTELAPVARRIRHLRVLAGSPQSQKEIRLSGAGGYLLERHDAAQATLARRLVVAQRRSAALRGLGQVIFGAAYLGSLVVVVELARTGHATLGDVVLVITLATQISAQVASGIQLLDAVHAAVAGFRRLTWLRGLAPTSSGTQPVVPAPRVAEQPVIARLAQGIVLEDVGFTYPGRDTPALRGVSLTLPAGSSVALVGENGAGKSTLISLLTGLYRPSTGRILVDGTELAQLPVDQWRAATAALFQDFARLDFTAQHSIGVGRLPDVESPEAVLAAVDRAGAQPLLERLGGRLDTLLGRGYGDGAELSGGQWQSIGFARTLMRPEPVLLCLDEPGHSLDPLAEERMVDGYRQAARQVAERVGGVALFVTHRMSTVRLAELIIVLHQGQVVEAGSHGELIAAGGRYAELYGLQSRAYA